MGYESVDKDRQTDRQILTHTFANTLTPADTHITTQTCTDTYQRH